MNKMQNLVLAACLLSATAIATAAPARAPVPKSPGSLQAAPAMVIDADAASHSVVLKVPSTGHEPLAFTVSPSCLFAGGLLSEANLFRGERVLIWTQGGGAGKLPAIIRVERAQN